MTQQYLRALSLVVGNDSEAYDFSNLRVQFYVVNADRQTLKSAEITVYNLSSDMAQRIFAKEFTRVEISAGYTGNIALIFKGSITMVRKGKLNATDTYVRISAQDGDQAFNWAVSSWTLASGYTADDLYKRFLQDLAPYGITAGYKPTFNANPSVDAFTCFGGTKWHLRTFAQAQGCTWSIENGQLNFLPFGAVYPGNVPKITPGSGLIGSPELTLDGIVIKSLLNPAIRAGCQINIDDSQVNNVTVTNKYQFPDGYKLPTLDGKGAYKTLQVIQEGDNRGNTWFTTSLCEAIDGTAPNTQKSIDQVEDHG